MIKRYSFIGVQDDSYNWKQEDWCKSVDVAGLEKCLAEATALLEGRSALDWDRRVNASRSRSTAQPAEPHPRRCYGARIPEHARGYVVPEEPPEPTLLERIEAVVARTCESSQDYIGPLMAVALIKAICRSARGAR